MRARSAKGIKLGKPKGGIQAAMYDKDKEKIISTHLAYGKYLSLKAFLNKPLLP
ncbi:hypothetical protein N748_09390 [Legionella pneumophila str. 121004]|nr:hypothetical protein LPC_3215 [Legionella pneumophila str. Corby]ERB41365.1 hypothetical protein N748_09390 [Legionella pneumophila str. 121004]ERH42867.1 hypothetical protein N750_02345 [Legionella pneumophila str. Leg01/53]ERH43890.1 hypothetical protein N751_14940 [Legionella pneumophila str. Leg01/11]ERI47299.1 hypothetical protein N749_14815 [Legionella pneumophila str. Leg01/20]